MEVPEHLSLLYPIQLRGRLQLDKNFASTAGQHEPSTSVFESTPPILHADELRRLAKLVVKIESLAGGKIQKEPTEMPEKDEDEKVESESTHPQHFVQLDTDNEDDNEGDSSTKDKGEKALNRHISHKDKSDWRDKEKEVFAVVPANLLAPAIPDGASDGEMISILEALVSRMNNAINTMDFNRVRLALQQGRDKDEVIEQLLKITGLYT